jgi:hypothetical protein
MGYLKVLGVFKGKKLVLAPPLNIQINPDDELILVED